jgi:hypothetical protein
MANQVGVAVGATELEIAVVGREPRVEHFRDRDAAARKNQRARRLFSPVACIALDLDREVLFAHLAWKKMRLCFAAVNRTRLTDVLRRWLAGREATARFHDVRVAEAEGYHLAFGCVSGPDSGAMGMHFVNMELVGDGILDATRPEIVIYEPQPNGRLRLIGADFLVFAADWHTNNPTAGTPELGGDCNDIHQRSDRRGAYGGGSTGSTVRHRFDR